MGGILFGIKAQHSAALDIAGKLYGFCFRCYPLPFAARQGCFGRIDRDEDFESSPLALFPQRKCFLYGIFLAVKPPALDGLANKRFLIGGQLNFHTISA
jgi:hypothetical protein